MAILGKLLSSMRRDELYHKLQLQVQLFNKSITCAGPVDNVDEVTGGLKLM